MPLQTSPNERPPWFGGEPPHPRDGGFPGGGSWEITPDNAGRWYAHRFEGYRGDSQFMRGLADLAGDEFALLLWDLDLYSNLVRRWERGRGPCPPPIDEYLRPGREEWGQLGAFAREFFEHLREMREAGELDEDAQEWIPDAVAGAPA